jgi:hypothetical protein
MTDKPVEHEDVKELCGTPWSRVVLLRRWRSSRVTAPLPTPALRQDPAAQHLPQSISILVNFDQSSGGLSLNNNENRIPGPTKDTNCTAAELVCKAVSIH